MDFENKCEYCQFYDMFIGPSPKCDCGLEKKCKEMDVEEMEEWLEENA
jgi:hypothetical protein